MGLGIEEVLRIIPWILTIICANILHYRSLWTAKEENRRQVMAMRESSGEESKMYHHELLTYDLMRAPTMRKARYKIKLLRFSAMSMYIVVVNSFLPELHEAYVVTSVTLECIIVGMLSGLITVYLNENQYEAMRTLWRPALDFGSKSLGRVWDTIRLMGASIAVPVEEELFYHSWMYRYIVHMVRHKEYMSFVDVSFLDWSWLAWLASNGIRGVYNGKEWKSYFISGLLFQWIIAKRGCFLDGLIAHSVSNFTIGCWVLATDQRQYW